MKTIKLAFLLSAVAFIALQLFYYGQMPERVATHFDFAGRPNGWMPRMTSLVVSCALVVFVSSVFRFVPKLAKVMGPSALNIPHKEYWLAPENADRLGVIIAKYMSLMGLVTNLFFIYLFHQIYLFNTGAVGRVSMAGVIVFLVALGAVVIQWLRRLYDVPQQA